MTFQKILLALKKEYGFHEDHLAKHLQVTEEDVLSWEQGENLPDRKTALRFAALFSLPEAVIIKAIEDSEKEKKDHGKKNTDNTGL